MLREQFRENLKKAMQERNEIGVATIRLIIAALKDRDIAARGKGNADGINEDEILSMLQTMVKQRKESQAIFEKAGRTDLATREAAEVVIIETFLPRQMDEDEIKRVIAETLKAMNASGLKDMGRVMAALREQYAGQMDFGRASALIKDKLAGAA